MSLFILTLVTLALAMLGMGVGVILSNRALRGSCGGIAVRGPDGEPMTCGDCDCRLPEDESLSAVGESRPAA